MQPLLSFLRFANRRTRNSPLLRRLGIRAYSALQRANVFMPAPRVLLNGPAKSGTHLLSDCLSLLPQMMFSGRHFALAEFVLAADHPRNLGSRAATPHPALDDIRLRRMIGACRNGSFLTAHAAYHPTLQTLLHEKKFKHLLLLRDPRDVAVSYSYFVLHERRHHHHRYYSEVLAGPEERLMATIRGFDRDRSGDAAPLGSIGARIEAYLRWLEDLVGPRGGSTLERQIREVRRIASFVERPLSEAQAATIATAMYSEKSLTFRKGGTGEWRSHFNDAHREAFKEVANPVLLRLGYETSDAW
jgi:sulfotransferase 6B1